MRSRCYAQRARIESSAANDVMSTSCQIWSQCRLAPHILLWLVFFVPPHSINKSPKRCKIKMSLSICNLLEGLTHHLRLHQWMDESEPSLIPSSAIYAIPHHCISPLPVHRNQPYPSVSKAALTRLGVGLYAVAFVTPHRAVCVQRIPTICLFHTFNNEKMIRYIGVGAAGGTGTNVQLAAE